MDENNRKKLEALGRTLPKPLPVPEPAARRKGTDPRHPVETSQDPEQLFYQLMGASPDGSIPPHMLERLRDLERQRQTAAAAGRSPSNQSRPTAEQDLYLQFQQQLEDADADE